MTTGPGLLLLLDEATGLAVEAVGKIGVVAGASCVGLEVVNSIPKYEGIVNGAAVVDEVARASVEAVVVVVGRLLFGLKTMESVTGSYTGLKNANGESEANSPAMEAKLLSGKAAAGGLLVEAVVVVDVNVLAGVGAGIPAPPSLSASSWSWNM